MEQVKNSNGIIGHLKCYLDPKLMVVFLQSVSSGIPFLLLLSTLSVWLKEAALSKTAISLFAWVSISYSIKFFLAPIINSIRLPYLSDIFGHKRGWLILTQLFLIVSLICMASCHPQERVWPIIFCGFLVGISSACQDVLVEQYRIELLPRSLLGLGASVSVLGYRVGMFISGAIALCLSNIFSWMFVYNCMACMILIGLITTLCSHEVSITHTFKPHAFNKKWLYNIAIVPYLNFLRRKDWLLVIVFIISYKACDTVLNTMGSIFLLETGFSKLEIAYVAKSFGVAAMVLGGLIGGYGCFKYSLRTMIFVCLFLQIISCVFFIGQALIGINVVFLFFVVAVENITTGMSQVVLVAYFTNLCKFPHSGSHFAILTSFSSFGRVIVSAVTGWMADYFIWAEFFSIIALFSIPAILVNFRYGHYFANKVGDSVTALDKEAKIVVS